MAVSAKRAEVGAVIHIPADICYTCHNSGVCCETFPKIPVDNETIDKLSRADFSRLRPGCSVHSLEEALLSESENSNQLLARGDSGACVFLSGDKRCELHNAFGADAKPRICQDFPFRYRSTPDGVYVGLSFVCPSVRGNRGRPLTEQRAELEAGFPNSFSKSEISGPVRLNDRFELAWSDYLQLEECLSELLDERDKPLVQRLIGLNVLVNFAEAWHKQAQGAELLPGDSVVIRHEEMNRFVMAVREDGYSEIFRIAGKRIRGGAAKRMFLGMITSFANTLFQRRGRAAVIGKVLAQYARHAAALGSVRLRPFRTYVRHRELAAVILPSSGPVAELLERYVRHCIFRKDLVFNCTLQRGVNLLLLNCALICWYAAAAAAQNGREDPAFDDFSEAIGEVEKLYGFHSSFYQYFGGQPILDQILESFLSRRNYPFLILS